MVPGVRNVGAAEARKLLGDASHPATYVDIRDVHEIESAGNIPGAAEIVFQFVNPENEKERTDNKAFLDQIRERCA